MVRSLHHLLTWSEFGARLVVRRWAARSQDWRPNFRQGFGRKMGQTGLKTGQVGRWGTTYVKVSQELTLYDCGYRCCFSKSLRFRNTEMFF